MFKKILITLGILIIVLIAFFLVFINWTQNPYGLELERLSPKGSEKIPQISAIPNTKNYLLYSKHENNDYLIHLPLPNEYIRPSKVSTRITKTYAASVTMYYPELNGKFHPENANLTQCKGYCGGYLRVYIKPSENTAEAIITRTLDRVQNNRAQNNPLVQFEDLDSEFGLDDHFQIRYPAIEKKHNGKKNSTKEYFLKRKANGEVQHLIKCSPYMPSPGCNVRINLSARPELLVDIKFGRHLMEHWADIISSVNKKVASWEPVRIETIKE